MKAYDETHQEGFMSIENLTPKSGFCDFGIQIAEDGRIWICVDGIAFIRFHPRTILCIAKPKGGD